MDLSVTFCAVLSCIYLGISTPQLTDTEYLATWSQRRESHKFKSLRKERMQTLADMSDMEHFKDELLKPILRVRDPGSKGSKIVQEHIKSKMRSFGWTIEEDSFTDETPYGPKEFNNIIAVQDPSLPRRLTFVCHFDSKFFKNIDFIGATDSAVPCAMMLDMAHSLNKTLWAQDSKKDWQCEQECSPVIVFPNGETVKWQDPTRQTYPSWLTNHPCLSNEELSVNDISLQFLFLDGEEAFKQWRSTDSIYGARHLAAKMADNMVKVDREYSIPEIHTMDIFILLDLIGASNPTFHNWFASTEKHFQRLQKIELQAAKLNLLKKSTSGSWKTNKYFVGTLLSGSGIQDDHIPFLKRDVPVLHMIAHPFPVQWHTVDDNEKILDYDVIDNLNMILRIFVAEYLHLQPSGV